MSRTTIEEAEYLARKHGIVLLGGKLEALLNLASLIDEMRGQEVAEIVLRYGPNDFPPVTGVNTLVPLSDLYPGMKLYAKLKERP